MPELPEVETVRRQLEPEIVGRRIASAEILDERLTRPEPPRLVERSVAGGKIDAVERRGKYLLIRLGEECVLILHLRMTGNLLLRRPGDAEVADLMKTDEGGGPRIREAAAEVPYLRARFELEDGSDLLFTDPRRFGQAVVIEGQESVEEYFGARVGVEPLTELTPEMLVELGEGRTAPLKSFLLNQTAIAGIGNIYADEALWRAELHPLSPAGSLKPEHAEALVGGIVEALEAGLDFGGASIDDYRDARGQEGSMQDEFLVHRREGEECLRCRTEIRRVLVAGRSTYFCPGCQVRLRRRPRRRKKVARGTHSRFRTGLRSGTGAIRTP